MAPYQDPLQQFNAQQKQAMMTGGVSWATELEIRKRLNREPRYAVAWSWYFPGGGMFFLGKPFLGILEVVIFLLVIVFTCANWRAFGGVIGTIVFLCVFEFLLTIAYCIVAYIVGHQLYQQACRDLEAYEYEKRKINARP